MGEKLEHFDQPVCNKFKPTLLNGQLCYKVDVNEIMRTATGFTGGLIFLMDYNEEKMMTSEYEYQKIDAENLLSMKENVEHNTEGMIYIETLGKMQFDFCFLIKIRKNIPKLNYFCNTIA